MQDRDEVLGQLLQVHDHTFQREVLTQIRELTYISIVLSAISLAASFACLFSHHR